MHIRFGSTRAVDPRDAARVRGAAAGLISGTVSVAAHGWSEPGAVPDSTAIMLLGACAAILGALVAGSRWLRTGTAGLTAALAAGQLVGHFCLGWGSGHLHHGDLQLTPAMLTAHLLAAGAAALLVHGAEIAYRVGAGAMSRLIPILLPLPVATGPVLRPVADRDRLISRLIVTGTDDTRAPPAALLL